MKKLFIITFVLFTIGYTFTSCNNSSNYDTSVFASDEEYNYVKQYYYDNIKDNPNVMKYSRFNNNNEWNDFIYYVSCACKHFRVSKMELLETMPIDRVQGEFSIRFVYYDSSYL